MRLSEIHKTIEENINYLKFEQESIHNNSAYIIKNYLSAIQAIDNLSIIPSLLPTIKKLQSIKSIYTSHTPECRITADEMSQFNKEVLNLKLQCKVISDLFLSISQPMQENTICIKLGGIREIQNLNDNISDLSFILNTISSNKSSKGTIKFSGVEAGSEWFYFIIEGAICLKVISSITDSAYNIIGKILSIRKTFLEIKKLKLDIEISAENTSNKKRDKDDIAEIINKLCDQEVDKLTTFLKLELSPEYKTKFIESLKRLIKLIENGTEVHPSLTAPKKTHDLISEKLTAIESQLKDVKLLQKSSEKVNNELNDSSSCNSTER